jgi:hypothetical protein
MTVGRDGDGARRSLDGGLGDDRPGRDICDVEELLAVPGIARVRFRRIVAQPDGVEQAPAPIGPADR